MVNGGSMRAASGRGRSGFSVSCEYSFHNRLQSEDESVGVATEGFGADLSFQMKADATVEDVFCVIAGKEKNAGRHTFPVSEGDDGFVCIDDGRKLTLPAFPEHPAVLVSRNGTPTWHEITGGEEGGTLFSAWMNPAAGHGIRRPTAKRRVDNGKLEYKEDVFHGTSGAATEECRVSRRI